MENLISIRNDMKSQLAKAEKDGKLPTIQVKEWLRNVEDFMIEVELIHEGKTANKKKLTRCFFSCSLRCRTGRKVSRMLKEVKELVKAGSFPGGLLTDIDTATVEHIPGPSIQDQTTASRTLAKVMDLLKNDGVHRIGVWGTGGVGKTTVVKNLNNRLKTDSSLQPFGMVIWATVSKELDLKRVQLQIAERLNLLVKMEETVERVGIRLHGRLMKESNFLLILDDVWEAIDLDYLGIPRREDHVGSKIILTSRNLDVCRAMSTDVEVRVDFLNGVEAWQLFCQSAGEVASLDTIKPFAEEVSRECNGLPLAIITMGTAMRGKKMGKLWKHALNEMRRSVPGIKGIENNVYNSLKWSYDSLEGKNTKTCFLYCSLFPEDFSIEVSELVRYWLAEGLIDEQENYEDSINRGIALIENLKDYCLLEDGDREGTVKMHDVVRDVAIWIGSRLEDRYKSLVRSGIGLNEISEAELLNSLKRVSFMNNKIKSLPDCEIQCSEASTLLLQGNFPLDRIPVTFLQGFPAIRVLNMSGTRIQSLPLSLLQLHDLRALILRDCFYLTDLPSLGGLTKLQVLDLCATSITELPRGLENLSNLRQLNLSRTHYLKTVQAGTISRLHSLEVLDMTLSDYHWGVKGQVEEGQITFEDLGCLQRLQVLFIRLEGIPSLGSENLAWIGRVKRYQFFIGPTANSLPTKHDKRRVTISGLNLSGEWIDWFLSNATSLVLNHCWGLNQMLETLVIDSIDCFTSLKSLTIASSNSYLRPDGGCTAHVDLLPNLEELHLHDLTYLESISELVGHLGLRFCRLKLIEVTRCSRLKYVLSYGSLILSLPNLEEIKVSFCDNLVQLFNYCSEQDFNQEPVVPNLRNLELKNLPKLRSLCRYEECWQHLEQVEVIKSNLLTKMPLTTKNENTIKEIRGELQWWSQLDCDNETKSSLQPYFKQTGAKQELRSMEMQQIDGMVL
ncbi:hypothetical protein LWI29_011540 [Acer saccharum]|uniref:AAA+ ATPase domain-containing protein n=1 Tax=Acer saccharum TaxID=4024 RepID=A0AA39SXA0_ACESA|nr:hypothetical protein LWI29_011540 [Acer saccharum]